MKSLLLVASSLFALSGLVACSSASSDAVGSSEQHATADIDHMFRRPDGKFDVWCADGTTESGLTAEEINMNLACGGPNTPPSSSGDGGTVVTPPPPPPPAPTSCLSLTPIDATLFPYKKANAKMPGACTAQELTDLGAYYRAHAGDDDLMTGWASSVSATCAQCAFTADETAAPATTWGPVVTADQKLELINRGGCIETASGSEACGRSYQQFQDCALQACLVDCTTQADFNTCRQDTRVLETSCKIAFDALKRDCDATKIGQYESVCKGTTYTFEGPIRVACMNP